MDYIIISLTNNEGSISNLIQGGVLMSSIPNKLHCSYGNSCRISDDFIPRCYTLTHSDSTGDLFLKIDCEYDKEQISSLYTCFMRDEVLAEWVENDDLKELHVYLHVSGGFVFGWAKMRDKIFRYHLPMVLEAIIYGDSELFVHFPLLKESPIIVHFKSVRSKYNKIETHGKIKDYLFNSRV